jgi:chromosome segregation ATPase
MSNLLSEICEQIDKMVNHAMVIRLNPNISLAELAVLYKQRVKKLLIKYEAKDNPHMKINELDAKLEAFQRNADAANRFFSRIISDLRKSFKQMNENTGVLSKELDGLKMHVEKLDGHVGGINEMQDEDTVRINVLEAKVEAIDEVTKSNASLEDKYNMAVEYLKQILKYMQSSGVIDRSHVVSKTILALNSLNEPVDL